VLKALRNKVGIEPVVLSHEEEGLLTVLGLIHPHDRSTPLLVGDRVGGQRLYPEDGGRRSLQP
jgi:exopolyphosphatase/pppGpp-phosphohydrolase